MLAERLRQIMQEEKLSVQELADKSEIPMETLKNILYGKVKDPKSSTLLQLSKALDYSMNYLLGEHFYTKEEQDLLVNYRQCGVHGKGMISVIAKFEANAAKEERNSESKQTIPCLVPNSNLEDGIEYNSGDTIQIKTDKEKAYLAIEITTNNFAPAYCKGDRILLENRFPVSGECAVFANGVRMFFRAFEEEGKQYRLKNLNGRGNDFVIKRMDEFHCIGTCIGVVRS